MCPYLIGRTHYVAFGQAHDILCNRVARLLRKRKYRVAQEKTFLKPDATKKVQVFRVDVYAEKDGEVTIVECGYTETDKLKHFKQKFPNGHIVHYPYLCQWGCVPKEQISEGYYVTGRNR